MDNLLYIIYESNTPNGAAKWWSEAAAAAGYEARFLYADRMGVMALPTGELLVTDGTAKILPWPDAVLMRCYARHISLAFERVGIPVYNRWRAMKLCRDKLMCVSALGAAGLPVPLTLEGTGASYQSLGRHLGKQFIVKPREGSQGKGVELVEVDGGLALKRDYIAQSYVGDRPGTDIRVWVLNGRAVEGVIRSNPGNIVSNFAAGGHPETLRGNARKEAFALAERAAEVCGLFLAGVDILYGPGEGSYTVCEVNGNAGFRTLPPARGKRLVKRVIEELTTEN